MLGRRLHDPDPDGYGGGIPQFEPAPQPFTAGQYPHRVEAPPPTSQAPPVPFVPGATPPGQPAPEDP